MSLSLNKPVFYPPITALGDPALRPVMDALRVFSDDILWQFRHIDDLVGSFNIVGDEIWIHTDVVNIAGVDYNRVNHIGPSTADATKDVHTLAITLPANSVKIQEYFIAFDARGHKVSAAAENALVFIGDETWVHINGSTDGKGTTTATIQHMTPSTRSGGFDSVGAAFSNGANSLVMTPETLYFDARGHRTTDAVVAGTAMTVSGDGTWINLSNTSSSATQVQHLDPSTATRIITVQGNDHWIVGSGTVDADAKGHISDATKSINLTHADPLGTGGYHYKVHGDDGATGSSWIAGNADISFDARGHNRNVDATINFTHNDPQDHSFYLEIKTNDAWIVVDGTPSTGDTKFSIDAKGHVRTSGISTLTHNSPQATANSDTAFTGTLVGTTVTLTPRVISFDTKGHRNGSANGTPFAFDLGSVLAYTADEVWITIDAATHFVAHIGPSDVSSTAPGVTLDKDATFHFFTINPQRLEFDERGHFVGYLGPPEDYDPDSISGGTGFLKVYGDGSWIQVDMDGTGGAKFVHIGPQARDATKDSTTVVVARSGNTITITPKVLYFDARGHRTVDAPVDGTYLSFDIGAGALYQADETWIHLNGGAAPPRFEHIGPSAAVNNWPGVKLTWSTTGTNDALTVTPQVFGVDAKGHVASASDGSGTQPQMPVTIQSDNQWINTNGNAGGGTNVVFEHKLPQAAANNWVISSSSLSITNNNVLNWDGRGHICDPGGGQQADIQVEINLPQLFSGDQTVNLPGGHHMYFNKYGIFTGQD